MSVSAKPQVYISYTWLNRERADGTWERVADERAEALAERLRAAGFDARVDVYFHLPRYGFSSPQRRPGDPRDPWFIWAEEQVTGADCVLMLCTPEYVASDPDGGACPGEWCDWHLLDDALKLTPRRPALWWDWHYIAREADARPEKFIPVGFGPYDSRNVPAFVRGATYYNLDSEKEFEGLLRRMRGEYQKRHPRQGVFVSYAHAGDEDWLDTLLRHFASLKQRGVEIWTDRDIKPGSKWHAEIQSALGRAKVAVLLVTPALLASPYIASDELPVMLRAAESEGLTIFPIPVKSSAYERSKLKDFQAAHPLSKPLAGLRGNKRDEALVSITSKLEEALGLDASGEP